MSWASKREPTRVEDMAYSLLGLFEVNVPILYGEGSRAFIRLQEEIMKNSDDQPIFSWEMTGPGSHGMLAESPAPFRTCTNSVRSTYGGNKWNRIPYSIKNMGLSIKLRMIPWAMETYFAVLDCEVENLGRLSRVGIIFELHSENGQYARRTIDSTGIRTWEARFIMESEHRSIYVRQKSWDLNRTGHELYGFWIRNLPTKLNIVSFPDSGLLILDVTCYNELSNEERIFQILAGKRGTAGVIRYNTGLGSMALRLQFDSSFNLVCQFDGSLLTALKPKADKRTKFEVKMDSDWLKTENGEDSILKGVRNMAGPGSVETACMRMSLLLGFDNICGMFRKKWIVDIIFPGSSNDPNAGVPL